MSGVPLCNYLHYTIPLKITKVTVILGNILIGIYKYALGQCRSYFLCEKHLMMKPLGAHYKEVKKLFFCSAIKDNKNSGLLLQ